MGADRIVRFVWAAPWSLAGLALAPFFRRRSRRAGVIVCEEAEWPTQVGWRYRAVALGHVVLSIDELDDAILRHELVHVRQYESWGPFFPFVYAAESLRALSRGGHFYRDNAFEAEARRAETLPQES
jgi:hypothetical protein